MAGTPRARGRAFGDVTGSVWDFGFYFKYKTLEVVRYERDEI